MECLSNMLPTQCNCQSDNQFRYPQPIIPPDLREKPRRPVNSDVMPQMQSEASLEVAVKVNSEALVSRIKRSSGGAFKVIAAPRLAAMGKAIAAQQGAQVERSEV